MTSLLSVTRLVKHFGELRAVHDLSFRVEEGEIVGLIGPNGAGKSTVFNLINGVLLPSSGTVEFAGSDITGLAPYDIVRRGLGRTFQIVRPLHEMTVRENCIVGACFGREHVRLGAASTIADEMVEFVGLGNQSAVLAAHLTIAGKKRLDVARALCAQPRLLLLDEALAGLNPSEVNRMIEVIKTIRARGVTILMIEHLMHAVMALSDRIVVINFGEKIAEGPPQEVARDPRVIEAYLGDPDMVRKLMEDE